MKKLLIFLSFLLIAGCAQSQDEVDKSRFEAFYHSFPNYEEHSIEHRRFTHSDIAPLVRELKGQPHFKVGKAGESVEGREIYLVTYGDGPIDVLLWSQMHGDEPTATMALMDIFNFLTTDDRFDDFRKKLRENMSIHFIPLLNPDGAEKYQRRNALGIDLNRDALRLVSPESRILKDIRDSLEPLFGYNLHDQSPYYTAGATGPSASLSFLAPAFNYEKDINLVRFRSMQMIALFDEWLQDYIPGKIGRYDDAFEPRAFGDNIQKWGTSTMLIESGGLRGDPEKQELRQLHFALLLASFEAILEMSYDRFTLADYESIPENDRNLNDLLVKNGLVLAYERDNLIDLAFHRNEITIQENRDHYHLASIVDMGDLSTQRGYVELDAKAMKIRQGKVYSKVLKSIDELESLDLEGLASDGVLYYRLRKEPASYRVRDLPVHILGERERLPSIGMGGNPALQVIRGDRLENVVVNGRLYSVSDGGLQAVEPMPEHDK